MSTCTGGASKVIIHHPKVIISPQKCPFFPQKPHLFNIFTLKNDLRTFVENCRESHLRDIMGQIAQDAWIRGWGGQPNLGNACILGVSGPATPSLVLQQKQTNVIETYQAVPIFKVSITITSQPSTLVLHQPDLRDLRWSKFSF